MKSSYIIAIAFLPVLNTCNTPIKKNLVKDTTTARIGKADTMQSITIDEPVSSGSRKESDHQEAENSEIKKPEQKDTRLIFPHFVVNLHDFKVYSNLNGLDNESYNGDTSEVTLNIDTNNTWTVTVKKDSLHLYEDQDNIFERNLIEVLPNNRTDRFEVFYSFQVGLLGGNDKHPVSWEGMTIYKPLKDSSGNFFRMPRNAYENGGEREIKKRLHLRDTLVVDSDEYQTTATLVYKNQPCVFGINYVYLRIHRFVKGKLAGINYMIFSLDGTD